MQPDELTRHFYASGLHRQGHTLATAMQNPAIARALQCAELAMQRRIERAQKIQQQTTHNKGATND